jgi:PAS domain S-box-containing protein
MMKQKPLVEDIQNFAQNIVDTVREPLLILDADLRVRSANRAFYQTFQVSPEETEDHLIYELGNGQWDIPALRTLLEDIVPQSSVFNDFELEHDFPTIGRKVMLLNARKLRPGDHTEFLVLAMEDVTERRRAERLLAEIDTYSQDIVDTVREPLLMLDTTLRVHSANRAFYQTFQVSAEETEHHLIYQLGNGQWDIPDLRRLLEDVVPKSSVFNDFELVHTFPVIGRRVMLLNARQLKAGSHAELLVLAMEDVTERRRAEEEVAKAAADLKTVETCSQNIVDTVREPLLMLDTTLRVTSANRAFYQTFHVSPEETEDRLIYELGNGQWDIPALRTLLEDVVPQSSVFNDFELEHTFPVIGRRVMLLNARQMKAGNHGELLVLAMEDVTERRRAEEALLQAGALQSAIFNSANFSSIATDAKGVIQIFNVGAERMLGYTAGEVMNKITPADISDPQEVIARAATLSVELGTPITPGFEALVFKASRGIEDIYELTYIRKDGTRFPAVVSVTALRDAQDTIIGYLLIGTELKAGALQSAIFNSANFSSIATDAKGVIQIFNVGAERMLGYTAGEVMNKITPADISDPQEVIARAATLSVELGTPITPGFEALVFKAARGIEDIYELTYIRKDGTRFPAVVSVTALRDAQDAIIGYLLIGTDNTARKEVEEEQKKLDQRLRDQQFYTRSLIESNIDALMTTDPRGIITDVNKQMEALTGCTRDELIGAPFKNYFTDAERAQAGIKLVLNEKKLTDYELTVRSRDGAETVVSYNATTFYDRDRKLQGVFAAARDVTERKRFEKSLQENNVELESAIAAAAKAKETAESANRTKSLFLANMSHELRTPLNAILGYAEMLQEEAEDQDLPDFLPDLQEIHGAGKHLLSLINDILDLSKIEAGKMELYLETFSVPTLIDEVVKTIRPLVEANANTLRVLCPADLGTMHADITKMRQSLFNLLSNAAKFTKEGDISLEVSRETMEDLEWIQFRITDTGIGMTEDQLIKLFQTFTQADTSTTRKFGGSGLGLALTRRFCQMMGGDVTVNSVPGQSSTFTIKVPALVSELENSEPDVATPVAPQAVAIAGSVREVAEALPPIGSSVLVIDDDPVQRELMRRFLAGEGFLVQTASNGEEGLRLARTLLPVAITLDVMMPGMDGWTVLATLKADSTVRDIPVIMLTMMDDKKRGYALGAADYTTKPVDRKRLLQILKKYSCPHPPCPVLLVGDDATTRQMMRSMLEKAGWAVSEAENGRVALECVAANRPVLILLDLMVSDTDGFEFAAELHRHAEWRSIPIIVLTAKDLTEGELLRLNSNVHQILDSGGDSREELMHHVRELLSDWAAPSERNSGENGHSNQSDEDLKVSSHV